MFFSINGRAGHRIEVIIANNDLLVLHNWKSALNLIMPSLLYLLGNNTLHLRARPINERARPTSIPQAKLRHYLIHMLCFRGRTGRSQRRTRSNSSTSWTYFVRSKVERNSIVTRKFGRTLYSHFGEPL